MLGPRNILRRGRTEEVISVQVSAFEWILAHTHPSVHQGDKA